MNEHQALDQAVLAARRSPCKKSKRGVVIWKRSLIFSYSGVAVSFGFNHQPHPFGCDGSPQCREACNKLCIHAEEHALLGLRVDNTGECEMIHVEVVNGVAVPSGEPSCWQCSRTILASGIKLMWLLHDTGLRSYSPVEFHRMTLQNCILPIIE